MSKPLRVGCIGAGYFSRFHYEAWARIEGAEPVASVNRDIAKAEATGLRAYSEIEAMLAAETPDIVDIITPPETHLGFVQKALAGKPRAIICQKPFCQNLDEARRAVDLAEAAGTPLIVHENIRFQPWYREIKSQIEAGAIGTVLQVTFRLRPGDGQGPRAYLERQPYFREMPRFMVHETGVHWVDTFRFLLGEPEAVFADLRKMNPVIAGEDAGHILFGYADGVRAIFDGNRLLDHAAQNTRCTLGEALVEGTGGTLELLGDGSVTLRTFGAVEAQNILEPSTFEGFGGDCVYHLQNHVVRGLLDGGALENLARDYLPVLVAEEAIYASAASGAWVALRGQNT